MDKPEKKQCYNNTFILHQDGFKKITQNIEINSRVTKSRPLLGKVVNQPVLWLFSWAQGLSAIGQTRASSDRILTWYILYLWVTFGTGYGGRTFLIGMGL